MTNETDSAVCKESAIADAAFPTASGVGATLTNAGAQAALDVDGITPVVADRIIINVIFRIVISVIDGNVMAAAKPPLVIVIFETRNFAIENDNSIVRNPITGN